MVVQGGFCYSGISGQSKSGWIVINLFALWKKWTISDQEWYQGAVNKLVCDQVGFDWSDSCRRSVNERTSCKFKCIKLEN